MKIRKTGKILVYTLAAVLILSSSAAYAYHPDDKDGRREEMRKKHEQVMDNLIQELGLSRQQQNEINKQRQEHKAAREGLREKIQARRELLKEELQKDTVDRGKVYTLVDQITQLKGQMYRLKVDGILGMRDILTPEQYKDFKTRMDQKKEEFKRRRGKKGGRGGHNGF